MFGVATLSGCHCSSVDDEPAATHVEAIASCLAAYQRPAADENESFRNVASSCAQLYSQQGCRDAWRHATKAKGYARTRLVVAGCRIAYCPRLAEPKPALCGEDFAAYFSVAQFRSAWPDFQAAVFEHDLGADRKAVRARIEALASGKAGKAGVVHKAPRPSHADERAPSLQLSCPRRCEVRLIVDGEQLGRWILDADAAASGFVAAAKRAQEAYPKGSRVIITATPEVSYQLVVSAMAALRAVGLIDVQFAMTRSWDSAVLSTGYDREPAATKTGQTEAPKSASSLRITCQRNPLFESPKLIVEVTDETFLRNLWAKARPKFEQTEVQNWGPDASTILIEFSLDDQTLYLVSWHRHFERGGENFASADAVRPLEEGETFATALAAEEQWYRDFRAGFDLLLDRAVSKGKATSALQQCLTRR